MELDHDAQGTVKREGVSIPGCLALIIPCTKTNPVYLLFFMDQLLCFDREYLTGFHKRKVHRQNVARELAKQKEHEEKLEARKEARAARKEMQEEKVQEYEKYRRRKSFFFLPCQFPPSPC